MHEVVIFPGARHGFSVRAHPGDKEAVMQGKQAEEQVVGWFNKCFEKFARA